VEPVVSRGRGCYICEPAQEPSGHVLTNICALKAWLNKPINEHVHVEIDSDWPQRLQVSWLICPVVQLNTATVDGLSKVVKCNMLALQNVTKPSSVTLAWAQIY